MINERNYVLIPAQAVTEYRLKGNELLVYSIIHGFTQDGEHWFTGSISYLMEWTNASKNTVLACIKSLVGKGLLSRRGRTERGVKLVDYQCKNCTRGAKSASDPVQKLDDPGAEIGPQNIEDKIYNIAPPKSPKGARELAAYVNAVEGTPLMDAIKGFAAMRLSKKKPINTDRTARLLAGKLEKLSHGNCSLMADILDQSTCAGWTDLYELKQDRAGAPTVQGNPEGGVHYV